MSPAAYTFSKYLNFSSNHTIGCLIAEVPLLAVGLLAFAISSFVLVVRKLDLAIVFLSSSALLDFFAGIVDVSQIIIRGSVEGPSTSTLNALVNARDIFLSLGAGARFFAFWAIVSQCPRGEICRTGPQYPSSTTQTFLSFDSSTVHAGSWMRWGIIGILLKWGTAATAISIALLQILWRTIDSLDNPGAVYAVENGLEIVVSVVFIIKMLLNSAIAETLTSWQMLLQYSPIISSLAVNIGLGIGNLAVFAFSESTIGRLLLAIELYITIETLLIRKFYPDKDDKQEEEDISPKWRVSSFQGLRVSPSDPIRPLSAARDPSPGALRIPSISRLSASGRRLSSWMARTTSGLSGRYRPALERDEARLFSPKDTERGRSPSPTGTDHAANSAYDRSPTEPKQSARYQDPVFTSFFIYSQREENALASEKSRLSPSDAMERRRSAQVSIPSYYEGTKDPQAVLALPPAVLQPDSPIFGLNGTLRGGRFSPITPSILAASPIPPNPAAGSPPLPDGDPVMVESPVSLNSPRRLEVDAVSSARSSSYEQLMREQSELEKSIAQLRMFASTSSADLYESSAQAVTTDSSSESGPRATVVSSYSGGVPPSASVKSEFSLSNFPEPPLVRRSSQVQPSSILREEQVSMTSDSETVSPDSVADSASVQLELLPPRMPAALEGQVIPSSTRTSEDSTATFALPKSRADSAGTQYDVTSFINTLSVPERTKATSSLAVSVKPDDEMSEPTSATFAEIVTVERRPSDGQAVRAYRLEGGVERKRGADTTMAKLSSGRMGAIPLRSQSADDTGGPSQPLRIVSPIPELFTQQSSPKINSPQVEFARTASGRAAGLPARPRMIGHPKRQSSMDSSPLAYERPRPAPGPAF
ncbi:hypothetical protein K488DRAFT_84155 [Vararia minispora EC-137]|uniref:Uncharacterized protein n=1 Tax=Vararia minispora EC-137 TaxID=1314806 RepID=A0ACB8QS96_9AGAM|nr:hypothetical protein K488DRAFT_84155 [Vararia minispora EC-137]